MRNRRISGLINVVSAQAFCKGYEFLRNRHTVYKNFANMLAKPNCQAAAMLAQELIEGYLAEEYDQVVMLFNSFRTCRC